MDKKEINRLCREKGITLGSVESFTGGLFASEITSVSGASNFFKGALVTYATEEKEKMLDIPQEAIEKYGVVSKEVAGLMAVNGKKRLDVDISVSFTGNAGPEAMEGKPVGEVHIGFAYSYMLQVYSYNLKGTRKQIQEQAIKIAFETLGNIISSNF